MRKIDWISVKADVESLEAELGAEAVDGLYSICEEGEDVSCMTLKRILGKRDKKYGGGNLFKR
ncbi:MAG TPA: hypothetical protein EYH45_02300 [Candidatus Caldiarchaeum subterraneum]|uniref:Uncharacterized protein n=1 Tax=Caldiarchaeum subterraneum TaxID=311458 RepID=A0A832ZVU6_CALS0|nr:hypothetical protein [Aigarchaeota archaeon]HIQ29376.1 hypothetical protein [Candidatus Caldarchaeum subterraneum]